jgi:hypothetical protein
LPATSTAAHRKRRAAHRRAVANQAAEPRRTPLAVAPSLRAVSKCRFDLTDGGTSYVTCFRDLNLFQLFAQPARLED